MLPHFLRIATQNGTLYREGHILPPILRIATKNGMLYREGYILPKILQSEESQTVRWCWAALMLVHVKQNTCLGCLYLHLGLKKFAPNIFSSHIKWL